MTGPRATGRQAARRRWFRRGMGCGCGLLVAALLASGGLWLARDSWLPRLYDWLDVGQEPRPADAIVVLGGGTGTRAMRAAELHFQGYAPQVIVSGSIGGQWWSFKWLRRMGVTLDDIYFVTMLPGAHTWQEAGHLLDVLHQRDVRSALIVTDYYHSRRARAAFRAQQPDPAIKLTFITTPSRYATRTDWWQHPRGLPEVRNEYPKLLYTLLRYGAPVW